MIGYGFTEIPVAELDRTVGKYLSNFSPNVNPSTRKRIAQGHALVETPDSRGVYVFFRGYLVHPPKELLPRLAQVLERAAWDGASSVRVYGMESLPALAPEGVLITTAFRDRGVCRTKAVARFRSQRF